MIIDCISDLHGSYPKLDGGDLLIVAGDLTSRDTEVQMALFDYWLNEQKYAKKIVIAGNHDVTLQKQAIKLQFCDYLQDSGTMVDSFKIWGSPWTRYFDGMGKDCAAFTCHHDITMSEKWDQIPDDIDILVTHGPPYDIADMVYGERTGCVMLRKALDRVRPKLHVFGHIHEGFGRYDQDGIIFVNASYMNARYKPVNKPIRIIL